MAKLIIAAPSGAARVVILTKRVAARELGPLAVFAGELVADAVEELDVALLRVLLQGGDEGPRHGSRCLGGNGCVGSVCEVSNCEPDCMI
jgi:hypothetical protein